jgi:hypothetical protein
MGLACGEEGEKERRREEVSKTARSAKITFPPSFFFT